MSLKRLFKQVLHFSIIAHNDAFTCCLSFSTTLPSALLYMLSPKSLRLPEDWNSPISPVWSCSAIHVHVPLHVHAQQASSRLLEGRWGAGALFLWEEWWADSVWETAERKLVTVVPLFVCLFVQGWSVKDGARGTFLFSYLSCVSQRHKTTITQMFST